MYAKNLMIWALTPIIFQYGVLQRSRLTQKRSCVDRRVSLVEYAKEESWEWIIIIIIKKGRQCKAESDDVHPISPKTPAPQYQPIDRKKRKGKRLEDYSRDRAA